MIFNLLDFQISTAEDCYYFDLISFEKDNSDCADGLYSFFHIARVQGAWFFDLFYLGKPFNRLLRHIFS